MRTLIIAFTCISVLLMGQSALAFTLADAAARGDVQRLNRLLAKGANVDERELTGSTPLMSAAIKGHVQVVRILLANGANVNAVNSQAQYSALHFAAIHNRADVVKVLLQNGADFNIRDDRGATPLAVAAFNDSVEAIQILHKNGADINATDDGNQTPLMYAALGGLSEGNLEPGGNAKAVRLLLNLGANVHAKTVDGTSALDLAIGNNPDESVHKMLRDAAGR